MSSKRLQSFASGILLATAALGSMYYFLPEDEEPETEKIFTLSVEEMKQELEIEGYIVMTEGERAQEQNEKSEAEENVIYKMVLNVESGMSSYDIAAQLQRGHIISETSAFLDFVEANQLTTSLSTGEYELSSEQSIEEIVSLITKNARKSG